MAIILSRMQSIRNFICIILLLVILEARMKCVYANDAESGESGSGEESGHWLTPSSGMLGDEIMPISNIDEFNQQSNDDADYADDDVQKRGKINRVSKEEGKTGTKRIWQYIHPYYHWLSTQQQPQQKPLQYNVPAGQCLDENSLCDVGHDEQCCGHASYCVDYWGVGKCLAYKQPDIYDKLVPARIHRNNLYKAHMRKMQYLATAGR